MHERLVTIRLVTENYRELQGLRLAGLGAVNAMAFAGWLLFGPPDTLQWLLLVVCIIQGFLTPGLNHYYESRFGVVEGGAWNTKVVIGAGLIAAAGAFAAIAIAASADPLRPDRSLAIAAFIHGLSLILPGLLDHRLLVRTMGRRTPAGP
jgi:hypothetical protein